MYEVTAEGVLAVYGSLVEGTGAQTVLALSSEPLPEAARRALAAAVAKLGYGDDALAFATSQGALGSRDLLTIVEGLDPLCLVAADATAAALLGQAYGAPVPEDDATRLMGRTVVAFDDFASLLGDANDKQRAWALLKRLPKIG